MGMLEDMRADTTAIIGEWATAEGNTATVSQRESLSIVSSLGGETTNTWTDNLTTQTIFHFNRGRGKVQDESGRMVDYDHVVYYKAGSDILEFDRIRMPGTTAGTSHYTYVDNVKKDADKYIAICSRRRRESE